MKSLFKTFALFVFFIAINSIAFSQCIGVYNGITKNKTEDLYSVSLSWRTDLVKGLMLEYGPPCSIITIGGASGRYIASGLRSGTVYTFKLMAPCAATGKTFLYSSISYTTPGIATPNCLEAATDCKSISLKWENLNPGVAYYNVIDAATGGVVKTVTTNSATIGSLKPNTSYTYKVQAIGTTNTSANYIPSITASTTPVPYTHTYSCPPGACIGTEIIFNANINSASPITYKYLYPAGSMVSTPNGDVITSNVYALSQKLIITTSGEVGITATDQNGCAVKDVVYVTLYSTPATTMNVAATSVSYGGIVYSSYGALPAGSNATITVPPNSVYISGGGNQSGSGFNSKLYTSGEYTQTVTNAGGCTNTKRHFVTVIP